MKRVPDGHRERVCRMGAGEHCCRYLVMGAEGFECAKLTELSRVIDERAENGMMVAVGDNCDGANDIPDWVGDA